MSLSKNNFHLLTQLFLGKFLLQCFVILSSVYNVKSPIGRYKHSCIYLHIVEAQTNFFYFFDETLCVSADSIVYGRLSFRILTGSLMMHCGQSE